MRRAFIILIVAIVSLGGCKRQSVRPQMPLPLALKTEQLQNVADEQLENVVADAVFNAMKDHYEWEYEIVQAWSPGLRMFHATWDVEAEVNNGGFNQYFWNTEGKFADMALEGFRLVGARRPADLMERAIAMQKKEAPSQQKYKDEGTLEAFSESYEDTELNKLDEEFYDLDENLSALRVKYIREHLSEFVTQ